MAKRNIDINKLPSNNLESPNQVTLQGSVKRQPPKPPGFSSEIRSIAVYLFEDVVLPAVKSIVHDFVGSGLEMMLWGERSNNSGYGRNRRRPNYHRAYSDNNYQTQRRKEPSYQSLSQGIDDLIFTNRQDAEQTLVKMYELIASYGFVTVGDLYSMVGWTSTHMHERYGWDRLDRVRIIRHSNGFLIDLPEPGYRN